MSTVAEPATPASLRKDDSDAGLTGAQPLREQLNEESVKQNTAIGRTIFQSTTTAPSPTRAGSLSYTRSSPLTIPPIQTDLFPGYTASAHRGDPSEHAHAPSYIKKPLSRVPSVKRAIANSWEASSNTGSAPNSAFSSPMLNALSAMSDVTPLPSPLMSADSPGPWKALQARSASRETIHREPIQPVNADAALVTTNGESISAAILNQSKRRTYQGLGPAANESALNSVVTNREKNAEKKHNRNRSMSEYVPEALQAPKPRQVTVSGTYVIPSDLSADPSLEMHIKREPNLAAKRGLAPVPQALTPPPSRTGAESDSDSSLPGASLTSQTAKKPRYDYFEARTIPDQKRRRWKGLRTLGEGTFSRVVLATSQMTEDRIDENDVPSRKTNGLLSSEDYEHNRRKLVAIKILEHGPKGGASEERIEMSLKRELEILKSIHHPSLPQLKGWNVEETRAILVLNYCPGGDLFDLASQHRELLTPALIRRMFAELVAATRYLHERHIVHRDIKLENVLVNLRLSELEQVVDWTTYEYSVVTLTDLGLSRRVADDEKLETRCGSEDYCAPEVILGQPYNGRAVDAWSLGVLLYALVEARLPFDPHPGRQRSRVSHRIARADWTWIEYAGGDGDYEADIKKFEAAGLTGAMEITEGLLKRARSRWTLDQVANHPWVRDAVQVEGGIKFREEDIPDEIPFEDSVL